MISKWFRQGIVLIGFLLLITALEHRGVISTMAPATKVQDRITVLTEADFQSLDPAFTQDAVSARITGNIFEGLVKYQEGSNKIEPALATSWKVSPDNKEWVFNLRRNVQFHDGTEFNSQAVKFSVNRVMKAKEKSAYGNMVFGIVDQVVTPNKYTVKFILKAPYAPFLHNLAMPWAAPIISPTAVQKYGDQFDQHPIGTGPFKVTKIYQGKTLILEANSAYYATLPQIKQLVFHTVADHQQRLNQLTKGEGDIATALSPQDVSLGKKKNLLPVYQPFNSLSYLGFYNHKSPFKAILVRRALVISIDRQKLNKELYHNLFAPAESPLPPLLSGSEKLHQYDYNPQAAKALLQEAGYPNGVNITLITYTNQRSYNPVGGEVLAQAIADQLKKENLFHVTIRAYPWDEFKQALKNQQGDCFLSGWVGDNASPDNYLNTLFTTSQIQRGLNLAHYSNPQVDRILASAQATTTPQNQQQLYYYAQQIILQGSPCLNLHYGRELILTGSNVRNFMPDSTGVYHFVHVYKVSPSQT